MKMQYMLKALVISVHFFGFTDWSWCIDQPRTAGSVTNFSRGSGVSWTDLSNTNTQNGSVTSTVNRLKDPGDLSNFMDFTQFSFSIPSTSVINGVTLRIFRGNSRDAQIYDDRVQLLINGVPDGDNKALTATTPWSSSFNNVVYGGSADNWGINPLNYNMINNSNFGVRLGVTRTSSSGNPNQHPEIDFLQLTIHYTSTLPISLMEFTADWHSERQGELTWKTASEVNSSHFEIERATAEHCDFELIGKVEAAGFSNEPLTYTFQVDQSSSELAYYRLKQVDVDGSFTYYGPIVLHPAPSTPEFKVFPNPARDVLHISGGNILESEPLFYQLVSTSGQMIIPRKQFVMLSIDVSNLQPGSYFLWVENESQEVLYRLPILKQ